MKNRYFIGLLMTLFTGLVFVIGGCGESFDSGPVLANVGGDKITTQDMEDIYKRSRAAFSSFDEELENRRAILDSLIIQQLLIREAYRRNIDELEEVSRIVVASKQQFLLDALYQRRIGDRIEISNEELREYYDRLEYKLDVSHMLFNDKEMALAVLDSLRAGANFEKLAVNHSLDPSVKTNRGSLGYITWGSKDMSFIENVFKLNPGEISEPFQSHFGWHIAKVHDRSPNEARTSFERMKDQIESGVSNIKQTALVEEFSKYLKDKYPVKVEQATCDYVLHRRKSLYPPQVLEQMPKSDFDLDQLDRDEKELVFASWEGAQMSLAEYLTEIKKINPAIRPDFDNYDSLAVIVFNMRITNILSTEAISSGIEDDPEFKRNIKRFKELAMADIMENDSLAYPEPPDDGELRQYYEDNITEYTQLPRIRVFEIQVSDFAKAKQLKRQINSLKAFKEKAKQLTERAGKRASGGDMGYIQEQYYPDMYKAADVIPVGDIGGPVPLNGKFSLLYIADKRAEETKDFVSVKAKIKRNLDHERRFKVFSDWVEKNKSETSIDIYDDNLRATIDALKYEPVETTGG